MYYKDAETVGGAVSPTAFTTTGQRTIHTGSVSLSASVALAFTAAALMY
jgi:hypothetical protein